MKLSKKGVVITGGAGGIGTATVRRLLAEGCLVSIWDISHDVLDRAAGLLAEEGITGGRLFFHAVDITDGDAVLKAVDTALSEMGRIDILINNAGHMAPGKLTDQHPFVWETTIRVNVTGVINVTHAVLPHFYSRKSGHVVNISSAAGLVGVSGLAVYSASKWAVFGLTEALRHEAADSGYKQIRFSSIHPNYISSGMFEGAKIKGLGGLVIPRLRNHDVVAKAIVEKALKKNRRIVRRPRTLWLATFLRGILPDAGFSWVARILNVNTSMNTWRGPKT